MRQPEKIHLRMVEVMKRFPEGISLGQMKCELRRGGIPPEDLRHLARRIRELDRWFAIEKKTITGCTDGGGLVFDDQEWASEALRAEALYRAAGSCQRCGKTIKVDGVTLVVQRKELGNRDDSDYCDDLWAVCEDCNDATRSRVVSPPIPSARARFRGCRMSTTGKLRPHSP